MQTMEVGPLLDKSKWSGYQKLLIFGTALTIILDGVIRGRGVGTAVAVGRIGHALTAKSVRGQ